MQLSEFDFHMRRLKSTFGEKSYSEEREKLIWREVEKLNSGWFARLVDFFIATERQAPLVSAFTEAVRTERLKENERSRQQMNTSVDFKVNYDCKYCKDNGVYLCKHNTQEGFWAFRCHCDKGARDERKHIPQYKEVHQKDYYFSDTAE